MVKQTLWLSLVVVVTSAFPCAAAPIGPLDTFEDGTTQGWTVALGPNGGVHPAPPINVASGGPAGADDNFLRITATGGQGPGSRLAAMNVLQWAGDYLSENVIAIRMDVRNSGTSDISLRLLFETIGAMGPTDVALSTAAVLLPAGSGWTQVLFPVGVGALTPTVGTVGGVLGNTDVLRIFHSVTPTFPPGGGFAGVLDVDNITLVTRQVPEPSMLMLVAVGAAAAMRRRRGL